VVATKHWSKGDQISSLIGNYLWCCFLARMPCFFRILRRGTGTVVLFLSSRPKLLRFLAYPNVILSVCTTSFTTFLYFWRFRPRVFSFFSVPIVFVSFSSVLIFCIFFFRYLFIFV
jgi:hypothetical protein